MSLEACRSITCNGISTGTCPSMPSKNLVSSTDPFNDGSLIAKYLLDGDATDLLGNYDGVATDITYENGKFGYAGSFNGDTSKIDTEIEISSLSTYSVSFVFSSVDISKFQLLIDIGNSEHTIGLYDSKLIVTFKNEDGKNVQSDTTLENDTLYSVVAIFDGTNSAILYISNIEQKGNLDDDYIGSGDDTTVTIGKRSEEYYFNGLIDQVEIYNRALNPQEVEMLYTQLKYDCDPTQAISGLVAHYPLDGTAEDLTGNYNGTENGGLTYAATEMGIAGSFGGEGSNTRVELVEDNIALGLQTCVSFWFKINGELDKETRLLHISQPDAGWSNLDLNITDGNKLQLAGREGHHDDYSYTTVFTTDATVTTDIWYYTVLQKDDNTYKLYVNLEEVGSADFNFWETTDYYRQLFGAFDNSDDGSDIRYELNGNISNVRVYDRALTQEEIKTIYNYEKITREPIIDNGLMAYYKLAISSEDHWVKQYDGTDTDIEYDNNSALFNGTSSYININELSNSLKDVNTCSITFWFKTDVTDSDDDYSNQVFSCHDSDGDNKIRLAFNSNKTFLVLDGENASGTVDNTYTDNKWYFACITIDDNLVCTINNDKILEYDYSFDFSDIDKVSLGQEYDGSDTSDFFKGNIKNVRVYNRALNSTEQHTIYTKELEELI